MDKAHIPLNLRRRVIERDGVHCVYCDEDLTDKEIEEIIEFCDPRIQGIKESIEKAFGVSIDTHSLYFYGHKKSEN